MLLMQHIDGGRQVPLDDDRQVNNRAATERPDLLMICKKNLGEIEDGAGDKKLMLCVHDFEPAVIADRRRARDGVIDGMTAVIAARRATSWTMSMVITVKSLNPTIAPVRICKASQHSSG
jgi:hypothetical protein